MVETYVLFGLAVALNLFQGIIWLLYVRWLREERMQLTKILASRNFTEYTVGEDRLKRHLDGRKTDGTYDGVWSEEQDG